MNSLARTLELSIASHSSATAEQTRQERRRSLEAVPNPIKRIVGLALDSVARDRPALAHRALDGLARFRGMEYIGHGADASVYLQNREVVKVYRRTALVSPAEKDAYVESSTERMKIVQMFLGPICVPQTYKVEPHPFGSYRVAVARQPYVPGSTLRLFQFSTVTLHETDFENYLASQHQAVGEFIDFLDGAASLHENYGFMPDLNGTGNFRVRDKDQQLAFVDPCPVARNEHPGIYDILLRQAETARDLAQKAL